MSFREIKEKIDFGWFGLVFSLISGVGLCILDRVGDVFLGFTLYHRYYATNNDANCSMGNLALDSSDDTFPKVICYNNEGKFLSYFWIYATNPSPSSQLAIITRNPGEGRGDHDGDPNATEPANPAFDTRQSTGNSPTRGAGI